MLATGGSPGISEMIATGFAANGAKVHITAGKAEVCDKTAARPAQYGNCISPPCDISDMGGIEQWLWELETREERLDVLVNNAGGPGGVW